MANEFKLKHGLATGETVVIDAGGNWVGPALPNGKLENNSVTINGQVVSLGGSVDTSLNGLSDVNTTVLEDGSVLVYAASTSQWTSTLNLNKQTLDGGEF